MEKVSERTWQRVLRNDETTSKIVESMLVAHGTGLVAGLHVYKEIKDTPLGAHAGIIIACFAFGFALAAIGYFGLSTVNNVALRELTAEPLSKPRFVMSVINLLLLRTTLEGGLSCYLDKALPAGARSGLYHQTPVLCSN
jgi:hypothetical protein